MLARLTRYTDAEEIARLARVYSHDGPLRIVAGIIWGQDKSAAEADCQRRVQLRYMESKCPDIRMEDIDLPLNGNVVINAQRRLKEAGR